MAKGFGNLMRQAQQMQKRMAELQEELDNREVEGEAGQGQVKAVVTCGYKVTSITIDKQIADPDDTETLEDLVVVAINSALDQARKIKEEEMGKATGGMAGKVPGLF